MQRLSNGYLGAVASWTDPSVRWDARHLTARSRWPWVTPRRSTDWNCSGQGTGIRILLLRGGSPVMQSISDFDRKGGRHHARRWSGVAIQSALVPFRVNPLPVWVQASQSHIRLQWGDAVRRTMVLHRQRVSESIARHHFGQPQRTSRSELPP